MRYTIKMKDYIQPFEIKLAEMELSSIVGEENIYKIDNLKYSIETNEEVCNSLVKKLTYWETIEGNVTRTIFQTEIESSGTASYRKLQPISGKQMIFDIESGIIYNHSKNRIGISTPNRRVLRYGPHDLHEYRGKFFPQLVRSLINISGIKQNSLILDPFCGSGTTACESIVRGMNVISLDLNPLSTEIAYTKCLSITDETLNIDKYVDLANTMCDPFSSDYPWNDKDTIYLEKWFSKEALDDIANIILNIEKKYTGTSKHLACLALSNILRTISKQKEVDLRVHKDNNKQYKSGEAYVLFNEQAYKQAVKLKPYLDTIKDVQKGTFEIKQGNTIDICNYFKDYIESCDLLITSPPYATALPYLDTDRLSLIALGFMHRSDFPEKNLEMIGNREISEKQREQLWKYYQTRREDLTENICELIDHIASSYHEEGVGFRRRNLPALLAKYFLDMHDSMKASYQMMKNGSEAYYIVGNNSTNIKGQNIKINTNELLWELGTKIGWQQSKYIDMELLQSRDIFKENCGTAESILMFKKD